VSVAERFSTLLRLPRIAVLPAVVAGAAASYDPSLRPAWAALLGFGLFLFATADAEQTIANRLRRATAPRLFAALAVALAAAVVLVAARGWPMFWVVTSALLIATAFVAGPRLSDTALAAPATIAWMGPIASAGAGLALTGTISPAALWIGVPIGFLADAIRRAHRTARLQAAGAGLVGDPGHAPAAPPWFTGDLVAAFGAVVLLVATGGLPLVAIVSLVALPWVFREVVRARGRYAWSEAAQRTRLLHAGFALLLAAATFAARVVATRAA
jgi:1,4-dihydroxy-2-naphthoate octaprenyltransferase